MKLIEFEGPRALVSVTETLPDSVPWMLKGTRIVARLPNAVFPAYHVLNSEETLNVIRDPEVEHPERPPQLSCIGVAVLNRKLRLVTSFVEAYIVIALSNPDESFVVVMAVIVGA